VYTDLKIKDHKGFAWPDYSHDCGILDTSDAQIAIEECKLHRTVIQAGGNCGAWPKRFAEDFQRVITFEPDLLNFKCLMQNVTEKNIFPFRAALGCKTGYCEIYAVAKTNCGDLRVKKGNDIPVMTIDSLQIPDCDLIYLDIQGLEYDALRGAIETIKTNRPIVVYEWANLGENPASLMARLGYKYEKKKNMRDQLWKC